MTTFSKKLKRRETLKKLKVGVSTWGDVEDLSILRPANYREAMQEEVDKVKRSILATGMIKPIEGQHILNSDEVAVVAGHHRLEAIKQLRDESKADPDLEFLYRKCKLRLTTAEAFNEKSSKLNAIVDNWIHKKDIFERASECAEMVNSGHAAKQIADIIAMEVRSVYNALDVAALPQKATVLLRSQINAGQIKPTTVLRLAQAFKAKIKSCKNTDETAIWEEIWDNFSNPQLSPEKIRPNKNKRSASGRKAPNKVNVKVVIEELSAISKNLCKADAEKIIALLDRIEKGCSK